MTVPDSWGTPNWIVGEDLYDFLCFGYHRGFFCMSQLAFKSDVTLQALTDPSWEPSEGHHYSTGLVLAKDKLPILEFLRLEMSLKPWTDSSHFAVLQEQYGPRLEFPSD